MSSNGNDDTDQESIRPVSSLLSHFERLSVKRSPKTSESRESSGQFLRAPAVGDNAVLGRASLDLPRPESEWSSHGSDSGNRIGSGRNFLRPQQTGGSPSPSRHRQARPLSMTVQPTPQRNPILTVDSPRSPPSQHVSPSPGNRFSSFSQRTDLRTLDTSSRVGYDELSLPSTRPTTPLIDSSGVVMTKNNWRKTDISNQSSPKVPKSSSVPPSVNRAEKPKIPAKKPAIMSSLDVNNNTLIPSSQRTSSEDRVSPFSTPPSSPEKTPPLPRSSEFSSSKLPPISLTGAVTPTPSRRTNPGARPQSNVPNVPTTRKPNMAPAFSTRGDGSRPPPPPPPSKRSPILFPKDRNVREVADKPDGYVIPEEKPGLPARPQSPALHKISPLRPSVSAEKNTSARSPIPAETRNTGSLRPSLRVSDGGLNFPPPRRESSKWSGRDSRVDNPQAAKSPARQMDSRTAYPASSHQNSIPSRENLADTGYHSETTLVTNTEQYPDASHTNRRPPTFRSGMRGINTKYDTRVFDVCGQYICTTGYFTRIWDLVTGEQVMSLNHGESVKGSAVAFKPGRTVDEEGLSIWLGTTTGELHEVDITTQAIVSSRSSHSRREIIKIYRNKAELWTLDDDGKLLVWPPDESGAPNLQYSYSNPYDRVAKGHSFSMVVGDTLWYASGKDVRIYQPNTHDADFQVIKTPLGKSHTGEVTSGTMTTKNGGMVYLGHADGKVTIYSSRDYSCLGTVNVSMYKISSLAMVGDFLWAGYKTGMIYIYDISTDPWTVKKDWEAHGHGVCGVSLDPSSLWTANRLHVVSLGVDNYIRLWDGMLEDYWLESKMQSKDVEYCQFREVTASIITWNSGATVPGNLPNSSFIRDAIHPESPPDILVFGFQELVDLENKKITAKSFFKGSKKKDHADTEHMSRQYRVWKDHLASCIRKLMPDDENYVLLHNASLIGLFTCVFVKQEERQRIRNLSAAEVKRGMGGLHGNKGALVLRFLLDDSSLCFINCHLAAGQAQTAHRNNDIAAIMESDTLPMEPSSSGRIDHFVGGGDGSMILDHEICILNGDLNYRIDSIPRNTVIEAVNAQNLPKLLDRDQLLASKRKNPAFRLRAFNEAPITFAPTYKYDVGTDNYDSSEKKRSPAWCDRILYRGVGRVKQVEYRRHEVYVSDHRPVSGFFKMRVKTILPQKRTATWEVCQAEFTKEKQRLAFEASVDYLVRFLGIGLEEAQSSLISSPSEI